MFICTVIAFEAHVLNMSLKRTLLENEGQGVSCQSLLHDRQLIENKVRLG